MADIVLQHNVGALITERTASQVLSWTAGSGSDNTTKTGLTIDREALTTGGMPYSMLAGVLFDATLGSGNTLSVSIDVQDSPDGANFSDFATNVSAVVSTGGSGGTRNQGQQVLAVDLTNARRYVRVNFIPHLSAAGTDTGIAVSTAVFGGEDRLVAAL